MNGEFYRIPVSSLSQGDIFQDVPSVYVPRGTPFTGTVQVAKGILLTHSCELDNSNSRATITFGLIRPLANVQEEFKAPIREGRNLRLLYLPSNDDPLLEEGYVDLSRLSSVRREAVSDDQRLLSATDTLLKAIYLGLIKYVTRFEVDEAAIDSVVQRAMDEAN